MFNTPMQGITKKIVNRAGKKNKAIRFQWKLFHIGKTIHTTTKYDNGGVFLLFVVCHDNSIPAVRLN